jgi:SAM-dependent methyltransferase
MVGRYFKMLSTLVSFAKNSDSLDGPMNDPLAGTAWSEAGTIAGFVQSPPNQTLVRVAAQKLAEGDRRLLDIGCGAGRNAVPLARQGWSVTGVDLSWPMLRAAAERAKGESAGHPLHLALAPMEQLPIQSRSVDFIVAHGIWNLARSSTQFRSAVREAGRVAKPGALLFVFTFSRATIPADAAPVAGEAFVFTQFSGAPQCFVTTEQLIDELGKEGFRPDAAVPLNELNRPAPGSLQIGGPPVIYEGTFRSQR